jgi:hypothetical protein
MNRLSWPRGCGRSAGKPAALIALIALTPAHGPTARYRERREGGAERAERSETPKPDRRGARSDVFDLHDLKLLHAGRRAQLHHVALLGAQ